MCIKTSNRLVLWHIWCCVCGTIKTILIFHTSIVEVHGTDSHTPKQMLLFPGREEVAIRLENAEKCWSGLHCNFLLSGFLPPAIHVSLERFQQKNKRHRIFFLAFCEVLFYPGSQYLGKFLRKCFKTGTIKTKIFCAIISVYWILFQLVDVYKIAGLLQELSITPPSTLV